MHDEHDSNDSGADTIAGTSAGTELQLVVASGAGDEWAGETIESVQTLAPGYYWRALEDFKSDDGHCVDAGDVLLLLDVTEFEGKPHAARLRVHPRHGDGSFLVLVGPFVTAFAPCHDAEAIRACEQQGVMEEVSRLQQELIETQASPQLMLEAVRADVEQKLAEADRSAEHEREREAAVARKRTADLAKTHRRAARRSEAKGNPLVAPRAALAGDIGSLIDAGVNEEGVAEMRKVAEQQAVIASAQANWLKAKTDGISRTLGRLMPYVSERAAVALARSSSAVKFAQRIKRGIESLDLYTGKGVDVFDICVGQEAPASEPLSLIQGKRYADEELAAWADVDESFDFRGRPEFFEHLAKNPQLRDQVLPLPRCVVSVAMCRRERDYGNAFESLMANIENKLVFLLVRNGENIHAVYSSSPSHEGAPRLFPTHEELDAPFCGLDGSRMSVRDVEFGERMARFEEIDLCYRRFLILLCGLDHRLGLLGRFYPADEQMQFMTLGFQQRHMRFVADEDSGMLLAESSQSLPDLQSWIRERNVVAQSGSRIFALRTAGGLRASAPELNRRSSLSLTPAQFETPFIAQREGARLFITAQARERSYYGGDTGESVNVKCFLDSSENTRHDNLWWLCVDTVDLAEVRRYRHSRIHRSVGTAYLLLLRRLEAYLEAESKQEAHAREYLLEMATTHGGLNVEVAREAMDVAIRNWRASRRGAALPTRDQVAELNEILSLLAPAGHISAQLQEMLDAFIAERELKPLMLTRSGKARLYLYAEASEADRAPYPDVLRWRWVKRFSLEAGKRKLKEAGDTLVWLAEKLPVSEVELRTWDGAAEWFNDGARAAEPLPLRRYAQARELVHASAEWESTLRAGRGGGMPDSLFERLLTNLKTAHRNSKSRTVPTPLFALPVGLYSADGGDAHEKSGRSPLRMLCMVARADSVLAYYGNPEQAQQVREFVVGRYARRDIGRQRFDESLAQFEWSLRATDIGRTGAMPGYDAVAPEDVGFYGPKFTHKSVSRNAKRFHSARFSRADRAKQGPFLDTVTADLSFNRSLDALSGYAAGHLRAQFHRDNRTRAQDKLRWWHSRRGDEDQAAAQARRKAEAAEILKRPYVHAYRSETSSLLGGGAGKPSTANSLFAAPVIASKPKAAGDGNAEA